MGGTRCTYRNCRVRYDGQTHMFHYPVYDKLRCREWLLNSRNFNFFNLSVAQLKNKVICEYHFEDNAFMNCVHNKLKHDAVPTINGPYCDIEEMEEEEDFVKELLEMDLSPLLVDDVENEMRLTKPEKQARNVLRYYDFLTSNDTDSIPQKPQKQISLNVDMKYSDLATSLMKGDHYLRENKNISVCKKKVKPEVRDNKVTIELEPIENNVKSETPKAKSKIKIISEKKITAPTKISRSEMVSVSPLTIINAQTKSFNPSIPTSDQQQATEIPNESSVSNLPYQITIENNIQNIENMPFIENIQDIENMPIVFLDENNTLTSIVNQNPVNVPMENPAQDKNDDVKPSAPSPPVKKSQSLLKTNSQSSPGPNGKQVSPGPKSKQASPGPKSKIPPERVAAIEEKRNFNKKLRDMIEFCLDDFDVPNRVTNTSKKQMPITPPNSKKDKPSTTKTSPIGKNPNLQNKKAQSVEQEVIHNASSSQVKSTPVIKDSTLASLEARIAEMEERLAQKIEKNSEQITELNDYVTAPESLFCRTPREHEEVYKKRLYKEISKFLSPEAKSLIYEELFMEKFGKEVVDEPNVNNTYSTRSAKRQKRR